MSKTLTAEPIISRPNVDTPVLQTREYAESDAKLSCPKCGNDRFSFGGGEFATTLQGVGEARRLPGEVKAAVPCGTCGTMLVVIYSSAKIGEQENTATLQHQLKLATAQVKAQEEDDERQFKALRSDDPVARKEALVRDLTSSPAPARTERKEA